MSQPGETTEARAPLPTAAAAGSRRQLDPRIGPLVQAEQVRTLYRQSAPVLLTNVLNAIIIASALWSHAPHGLLLGWVGAMTAMALMRIQLRKHYWARERSSEEQAAWGVRFTLGSLCAGLLWGFAGSVLMPASLAHQLVVVFVLRRRRR